MKNNLINTGIAIAIAGVLLAGSFAYAGTPSGVSPFASIVSSIASSLGFTSADQTSLTSGGYKYNTSHGGLNAEYVNSQGDTLDIVYCDNGANVETETSVCSSAPNACGMVGTGFSITTISHEGQVQSSSQPCNAKVPSNNLCPANQQDQGTLGNSNNDLNASTTGVSCPTGELDEYGTCVATCDVGYAAQGDVCLFSQCPSGTRQTTDANGNPACVSTSCSAGPVCLNGNLYTETAQCVLSTSATQTCTYGCSSGACNAPPSPAIGTWQIAPVLLQSGQTTELTWQAQNVTSCTVTGSNGDGTAQSTDPTSPGVWMGTSGSVTSSPIDGQTIFTIKCGGIAGAAQSSISQSTTVNIAPNYNEQ